MSQTYFLLRECLVVSQLPDCYKLQWTDLLSCTALQPDQVPTTCGVAASGTSSNMGLREKFYAAFDGCGSLIHYLTKTYCKCMYRFASPPAVVFACTYLPAATFQSDRQMCACGSSRPRVARQMAARHQHVKTVCSEPRRLWSATQ